MALLRNYFMYACVCHTTQQSGKFEPKIKTNSLKSFGKLKYKSMVI